MNIEHIAEHIAPALKQPSIQKIIKIYNQLRGLKGLDMILERVLFEARQLARAEAGSIFLVEADHLLFSHVQNEILFTEKQAIRNTYLRATLPLDENSIAGYVATHGQPLAFDDVYQEIDDSFPFRFNSTFDRKSGYRTESIFTLPVFDSQRQVVAVMQIINARNAFGARIGFSSEIQSYIMLMAEYAASAIENGIMTHELVLRMIQMAELRDPSETGAHVQRVGAYTAEVFVVIARRHNWNEEEIRRQKDVIRVAAMLHDVGKVGISDKILKKPGKLTEEEFNTMKLHTILGARLFINARSDLDRIAAEIALHHHQRWDGQGGYPGMVTDTMQNTIAGNTPIQGEAIPLPARIAALTDVFDALISPRSYKPPWTLEKTLSVIQSESGRQFDPRVVEAFMTIQDIIEAIRQKFV